MSKKPNLALAQLDPRERTLAERTLDELRSKMSNVTEDFDPDDLDAMIEILNLAFLEARADVRMDEVEPWDLTIFPKRFYGVVRGEKRSFLGELPEVGTHHVHEGLVYFVGSHKA